MLDTTKWIMTENGGGASHPVLILQVQQLNFIRFLSLSCESRSCLAGPFLPEAWVKLRFLLRSSQISMTPTSTLPLKSPMVRTHPSSVAHPSFLSLLASILFSLQRPLQQTGRTNRHIQKSGQQSQIQMTSRCPSTLSAPGRSAYSGPFSSPASTSFSTCVIPVSP